MEGLQVEARYPRDLTMSPYDQALKIRQQLGLELSWAEKMLVLDHLSDLDTKIDISGGDVVQTTEGVNLVQEASNRFGRHRVTLTATGAALRRNDLYSIAPYIGELNFTLDGEPDPSAPSRPKGYSRGNLLVAKRFAQMGIATRAECPLTKHNLQSEVLKGIYKAAHDAGIRKLLVMRLFPSGRGELRSDLEPSRDEYVNAISILRDLEARLGSPRLKLQCALKHLDGGFAGDNPCDAVTKSFGLMADGTLLGSPWAIGPRGKPIDSAWVLGNLVTTPMTEILASDKVVAFRSRADENWGECKFRSFTDGSIVDSWDRIFEKGGDSLYENTQPPMTPAA
jgi:MoaA/NifB/PqqE/SkfB family radical SAM enzyme